MGAEPYFTATRSTNQISLPLADPRLREMFVCLLAGQAALAQSCAEAAATVTTFAEVLSQGRSDER